MTINEIRERILEILSEADENRILLSKLGTEIKVPDGKKLRDFLPDGKSLSEFLAEDEELQGKINVHIIGMGTDYVTLSRNYAAQAQKSAAAPKRYVAPSAQEKAMDDKLLAIIDENLDQNTPRTLQLSRLNTRISAAGLGKWSDYLYSWEDSRTIRMQVWAENHFSRHYIIKSNDDGLVWYLVEKAPNRQAVQLYPGNIDWTSPESQDEVNAMHNFAYMGADGFDEVLRRQLSTLSGYTGTDLNRWAAFVAHCIVRANLLGEGRYTARSEEDGKEYLAIALKGLTASKNRQIYIVFEERSERDTMQQLWKLHSCCYPGNFGQGKWLKDVLKVPVHDQRQISLRDVTGTIDQLRQRRDELGLVSALKEAAQAFEDGLLWDGTPLIAALEEERKNQNTLRNQLYEFGLELGVNDSITGLKEKLEQGNTTIKQLEDYLQNLLELIRGNHRVFGEDGAQAFCADEAYVESLMRGAELTDDAAEHIGELVRYHAALCALEVNALGDKIAEHLNVELTTLYRTAYREANEAQLKSIYQQYPVKEAEWNKLVLFMNSEQEESSDEPEPQRIFSVDNEARSRVIREFLESDGGSEEQLNQVFASPNDFEKAIMNGESNRIMALAEELERFGYDEGTISSINDNLYRVANLPIGLTPLYLGNRLKEMIGNAHNQAERCWLLAVRTNSAAYTQLLELYMEENRSTDFMAVYTNAPYDIRGEFSFRHHMIKCCHAAQKYENVLSIVRANPEILYHSEKGNENLIMIYDCAVLSGDQKLIECCTQIQKNYINEDKDQLDDAIINNQLQWIMQFTDDSAVMETLHPLDEEQMAHLRSALTGRDLPEGDSEFERALRLWMLQRNRNCMAEYYMWRAIDRNAVAYQAEKLVLPLLDEAKRDAEMHLFFSAYDKELDASRDCRAYRLRLLCRMAQQSDDEDRELRVDELRDYVRKYLGDAVLSSEYELIASLCDEALGEVLVALKNATNNPLYAALIGSQTEEIRQFSTRKSLLAELGFSPAEIEQVITQIFNGNYPKKQDPLSLSWRIYRFVGIKDGLAELVSDYLLAHDMESEIEPGDAHLRILAEICNQKAAWDKLSGLFASYPGLIEKAPELYAALVVRTRRYETYAEQKDTLRPYLDDRDRHIFDLIAALHNEQCDDETCLRILTLSDEEVLTHPDEMIHISRWLTERGAGNSWNTLIPGWFLQAMKTYTTQQCAALLSADGLLDQCALTAYQQQWSGTGEGIAAAVFVGRYLGGAEMSELEESYYSELMEHYSEDAQNAAVLAQLKMLYPDRAEEIRIQTTLHILQSSGDASVDPVDMDRLCERIKDTALPLEEQEKLSDSLLEIDDLPAALVSPAIGLWLRLLAGNRLTERAMEQIRARLRAQRPVSSELVQLFAVIYAASGYESVKNLATAGDDSTKSLFKILSECESRNEVKCFFADAQLFVTADEADSEILAACAQQEEFCTDADAERVLRAFLAAGGTRDHQALRNLPLARFPKQRLWLLEQCALLSHKSEDWRYCINYAETTGQVNAVSGLFGVWLSDAGNEPAKLIAVMDHMNSLLQLDSKVVSGDKPEQEEHYREIFPKLCAAAVQLLPENYANIKRYQKTMSFITGFAVRFGCAQQLVDDDATLALYLRSREGECSCARVALLCRLLLAGRTDEARVLLRKVREGNLRMKPYIVNERRNRPTKYHAFFMRMADMSELSDYVKKPEIRVFLERFLPDGYNPSVGRFQTELVWPLLLDPNIKKGKLWAVARALDIMHELNPWDPVITRAQFYVLKQVYDRETVSGELACENEQELIRMLYRAQDGICQSLGVPKTYRDAPRFCDKPTVNVQLSDLLLTGVLLRSELPGQWDDASAFERYRQLRGDIVKANPVVVMSQENVEEFITKKRGELDAVFGQEKLIAKHMILSRVTGCWRGLVLYLFRAGLSMREYDEWCWDTKVYDPKSEKSYNANYHNFGLLRSLLQIFFELPEDQRTAYRKWLAQNQSEEMDAFRKALGIFYDMANDKRKIIPISVMKELVRYPLEEMGSFLGLDFTERCMTSIVDKVNINIDQNNKDKRNSVGEAWRGKDYQALGQCARWVIDIQSGFNNHQNGFNNQILDLAKRSMRIGGRQMDTINAERLNLAYTYFEAEMTKSDESSKNESDKAKKIAEDILEMEKIKAPYEQSDDLEDLKRALWKAEKTAATLKMKAANYYAAQVACAILGKVKTPGSAGKLCNLQLEKNHPDVAMLNALLRVVEYCPDTPGEPRDHLQRFLANLALEWENPEKKYQLPKGKAWGNDDNNGEDSADSIRGFLLELYPVLTGENPIGRKQNNSSCDEAAYEFVTCDDDPNRRKIRLELLYHLQNYRPNQDSKKKLHNLDERKPDENRKNFFRVYPSLEEFAQELPTGAEDNGFKLVFPEVKWENLMGTELLCEKFRQLESLAPKQTVTLEKPESSKKRDFVSRVLNDTKVPASIKQSREEIEIEIKGKVAGSERRLACAKLYQLEKKRQPRIAKLRLGLEEFYYQCFFEEDSTDTLLELIVEAARCDDAEKASEDYPTFREKILSVLPSMLRKNYGTIDGLIDFYVENYDAFSALGKLLSDMQDGSEKDEAQKFLEVLDSLRDAHDSLPDQIRLSTLKKVKTTLSTVRNDGDERSEWKSLRGDLLKPVIDAMTAITARPRIKIEILNREEDPTQALFGQITNTGEHTAEDIVLNVTFDHKENDENVHVTDNPRYLDALRSNKTAAFGVRFTPHTNTQQLHYTITVTYKDANGKEYNDSHSGVFMQRPLPETVVSPGFNTRDIDLDDFTWNEGDTDVSNSLLVGRGTEMRELRAAFRDSFGQYQNTVIYGFRRTGKTTLLCYLYQYLKHCAQDKEQLHVIKPITCQDVDAYGNVIETLSTFREALVDRVLQQLKQYTPDGSNVLTNSGEEYLWKPLKDFADGKPWLSANRREGEDLSSSEILSFYDRLSLILGKKIVVFMDEFDILFRYDTPETIQARLTTLDALLTQKGQSVRFVLCGSNYMCKLILECRTQAFQRVSKVLQIDRVPDGDMKEYLEHSSRTGTGQVSLTFTDQALECLYRLTNGIIYFAGKVMMKVADALATEHRRTVYPDDLVSVTAIGELLSPGHCNQFVEGLDSAVYTALAKLSVSDETLVPEADIRKELPPNSDELNYDKILEETLALMKEMKVIERKKTRNGDCVRFTCELYRRYFRISTSQGDLNPTDQQLVVEGSDQEETTDSAQRTYDDYT